MIHDTYGDIYMEYQCRHFVCFNPGEVTRFVSGNGNTSLSYTIYLFNVSYNLLQYTIYTPFSFYFVTFQPVFTPYVKICYTSPIRSYSSTVDSFLYFPDPLVPLSFFSNIRSMQNFSS